MQEIGSHIILFVLGPFSHSKILRLHLSDISEALTSNFYQIKLRRKVIDLHTLRSIIFLNSGTIPYNMVYLLFVLPKEKYSTTS